MRSRGLVVKHRGRPPDAPAPLLTLSRQQIRQREELTTGILSDQSNRVATRAAAIDVGPRVLAPTGRSTDDNLTNRGPR
jgi:hypothetical protein